MFNIHIHYNECLCFAAASLKLWNSYILILNNRQAGIDFEQLKCLQKRFFVLVLRTQQIVTVC